MAAPNTGGQLRTKISDMKVGDFAICRLGLISALSTNIIYEFGTTTMSEIPVTGSDAYSGSFYLIKADKGLLVADRVVRHTISWDTLNSYDLIQGKNFTLDNILGIIRSLGGGNSYASVTGTSQTTDAGLGAWPTTNEWEEYIVRKDYGTGAGRDDVWNWKKGVRTVTQDTHFSASANRTIRGTSNTTAGLINELSAVGSSSAQTLNGFRPCFEYQE